VGNALGVHPDAPVPKYHSTSGRRLVQRGERAQPSAVRATAETRGQVALFATCYGNRNEPDLDADLAVVFRHNDIPVKIVPREKCCGMLKLELGDLESIEGIQRSSACRHGRCRLRPRRADSAIADEDLDRENDEKTSSVHFLRFELTPAMVEAAKRGDGIGVGIDHDARHAVEPLPQEIRDTLVADLA
jgi:hypothetical protein